MSNKTQVSNSIESIWSSLQATLRNVNLPEVVNLPNGARAVYYPAGSLSNEPGYKNMNSKEYIFVSPSGSKVTIESLNAFCKDMFGETTSGRGKYASNFSELVNGKRQSVMGWTLYKEEVVAA